MLDQARRGTLPGVVRTGATFADAASEYLRYVEHDRGRKPSTLRGCRSCIQAHLLPVFGELPVEAVTSDVIERWLAGFGGSPRSQNKLLIQLHGILRRAKNVYALRENAAAEVEKSPQRSAGDIQVFSPEEVWALVQAAESEQDAAIFLTAAFTGWRMGELLALHWRDVDFAGSTVRVWTSYYPGQLTTPKSGKVRSLPLASDVAARLAKLGQRHDWVGEDDLVFVGVAAGYLDGSALRRRYKEALGMAGLRLLRFHEYASHLRDADDRQGRYPSGPGVDGPRRRPDDDALPALRAASGGCRAGRRGVCALCLRFVTGHWLIDDAGVDVPMCRQMSEDVPRRPRMSVSSR